MLKLEGRRRSDSKLCEARQGSARDQHVSPGWFKGLTIKGSARELELA